MLNVGKTLRGSVYDPRPSMAAVVGTEGRLLDDDAARPEPPDERRSQQRLGLLGLLFPRSSREWCCDACRQAAEPRQTQTW
jgi:hypothetical protein